MKPASALKIEPNAATSSLSNSMFANLNATYAQTHKNIHYLHYIEVVTQTNKHMRAYVPCDTICGVFGCSPN